jgi:hypothetical protein
MRIEDGRCGPCGCVIITVARARMVYVVKVHFYPALGGGVNSFMVLVGLGLSAPSTKKPLTFSSAAHATGRLARGMVTLVRLTMIVGDCLCHLDPSSVGSFFTRPFLRLTLTSCGSKVFSRFVFVSACIHIMYFRFGRYILSSITKPSLNH